MKNRFLVLLLFIILLTACGQPVISSPTPVPPTPSVEQIDKSMFTGVPCAAPCWHGLEVGKSNERDVISVLPTLTFIDQKSVQIYRKSSMPDYYVKLYGPGIKIVANCINSSRECLEITTANDVLQKIIVGLNYEIRPDEAIGYLGNPDFVGYDNLGSETIMCEVYLVWKSSRLVLATRFEDIIGAKKYCDVVASEGKVPASLKISEARFLSEEELNAKLSTGTGTFFKFTNTLAQ